MAAKRIEYILSVGRDKPDRKPFIYNFGRTKGIELSVSKKGFYIRFFRTVKKSMNQLLEDPLVIDAVKKVVLVQILKYHTFIDFDSINVNVDGVNGVLKYQDDKQRILYTMLSSKTFETLDVSFKNETLINNVVNTVKSNYGRNFAALFALLMACSKNYESEKFIYLWMSMNGLYGYVKEYAIDICGVKKFSGEGTQIKLFALIQEKSYQDKSIDDQRVAHLIFKLENICKDIGRLELEEFICDLKKNNNNNIYVKRINDLLVHYEAEKMHPYLLMLLWFPYKIRCKYFHAENVMPMLCFRDEQPIPTLRVLNGVLFDYLNHECSIWLYENEKRQHYLECVNQVLEKCNFNTNKLRDINYIGG